MAFTLLTSEENQLLSLGIRYILLPEATPPALSLTTIPNLQLNLPAEPKQAQRVLQQRAFQQNTFQQNAFQQNASQQRAFQQNAFQQNASQQRALQQNTFQQNAFQQNTFQQNASRQRAFQQNASQQRAFQKPQTRVPYYSKLSQASQKSYSKPTELHRPKKEESLYRLRPFNDWPDIWKNYFQKLVVPQDKNNLVVWTYLELDEDMRHQNPSWSQHKETIPNIIHHTLLPPRLKPDLFLPMKLKGLNFELDIFLAVLYRVKVKTLVCFGEKTIALLKFLKKSTIPVPVPPINNFSFWAVPMKSLEELANSSILRLQMELLQSFSKQKNKKFLK